MADSVREFVKESLQGFYERLPLKEISVNGEPIEPSDGTADIPVYWKSGTGTDSIQTIYNDGGSGGDHSVSEGKSTNAAGNSSHSEGQETVAVGNYSHAEGIGSLEEANFTIVSGSSSNSYVFELIDQSGEGPSGGDILVYNGMSAKVVAALPTGVVLLDKSFGTISEPTRPSICVDGAAVGTASHSEGSHNTSAGGYSHSEGLYTQALNQSEHSQGQYNLSNKANSSFGNAGNTIHSIGIGTGNGDVPRKNAVEVMQNGDMYLYNAGDYDGTNPSQAKTVQELLNDAENGANVLIPNFDNMTPIKTFTLNLTDANNYMLFSRSNVVTDTDILASVDDIVMFRVTCTGNVGSDKIYTVTDFVVRYRPELMYPLVIAENRGRSYAANFTGIYIIRFQYPKAVNNGYDWICDFRGYNPQTYARTYTVEVFADTENITWYENKQLTTYNSTYQSDGSLTIYDRRGVIFNGNINGNALTASSASYTSTLHPKYYSNNIVRAGEYMVGGCMVFASDYRVYNISNKNYPIDVDFGINHVGTTYSTYFYQNGGQLGYTQFRCQGAINISQPAVYGSDFVIDPFNIGDRLYLQCSLKNGRIYSDGHITTEMTPGHTWYMLGGAATAAQISMNTSGSFFITLDDTGKVTHINGKPVSGALSGDGLRYTNTGSLESVFTTNKSELQKVLGRSIVYNQVDDSLNTSSYELSSATINISSGVITMNASATNGFIANKVNIETNHYYCWTAEINTTAEAGKVTVYINTNVGSGYVCWNNYEPNNWQRFYHVSKITATATPIRYRIYDHRANGQRDAIQIRNVCCFDLTRMFGSGNEISSIDYLMRILPNASYAYDTTGSLISASPAVFRTTSSGGTSLASLAANIPSMQMIPSGGGSASAVFSNGLNGIGDVRDEVDLENGTAVKRIGRKTVGSLTWTKQGGNTFYATVSDMKSVSSTTVLPKVLTKTYLTVAYGSGVTTNKTISCSGNKIYVCDTSYSAADSFKSAMTNEVILYELATPAEYDIPSQNMPTTVYQTSIGGTESWDVNSSASISGAVTPLTVTPDWVTDYRQLMQPDWNENNESSADHIKNRPAIRKGTSADGLSVVENDINNNVASAQYSHAEGQHTQATGGDSHAEGYYSVASGDYSHAEGWGGLTYNEAEHAEGKYNSSRTGLTLKEQTRHSVGIGTDDLHRKNAIEIMADGSVFVNNIGGYNVSGASSVKTLQAVIDDLGTSIGNYLPLAGGTMTGAIKRYYGTASNEPMVALTSNAKDTWLWRINNGSSASVATSGVYGFGLKYKGTGSGVNKTLSLYADNQTGSQVEAVKIDQTGKITVAGQIVSTVATNTSPLSVASTTMVTNLNSEMLGGKKLTELLTSVSLAASGNDITASATVGGTTKTSSAFTVPFATTASKLGTSTVGSAHRPIYLNSGTATQVTDVASDYIGWAANDHTGLSAIEALFNGTGNNALAFLKANKVDVEYTNNGGTTWLDYGMTANEKLQLFSTTGTARLGKKIPTSENPITTNDAVRITVHEGCGVYMQCNFIIMQISCPGATDLKIEYTTFADTTTYQTFKTYRANGSPVWVAIPIGKFLFGNNQWHDFRISAQYVGPTYPTHPYTITCIKAFGPNVYSSNSNMGKTGHLYGYDELGNATFPANITAAKFIKSGGNGTNVLLDNGNTALLSNLTNGVLDTTQTSPQQTSSNESFGGTVKLHKISKTGSYNDLGDKPTIPTVPTLTGGDGISVTGTSSKTIAVDLASSPGGLGFSGGKLLLNAASSTSAGYMSSTDYNKINFQLIPDGSDLNDYTTEGCYYVGGGSSGSSSQQTLSHTPYGSYGGFSLFVLRNGKNNSDSWYRLQIYSQNNGCMWQRNLVTAVSGSTTTQYWRDWAPITPITIDNGADLNNFTMTGIYVCTNDTWASGASNKPSGLNKSFKLEVISNSTADTSGHPVSPTQVYQRLTTREASGFKRYDRNYSDSTWGDWNQWYVSLADVQSDWEQGSITAPDYIDKKPSIKRGGPSTSSIIEGNLDDNTASGTYSHAEGNNTSAVGNASHAEGRQSTANGNYAHAEGYKTATFGNYAHAEGYATSAYGDDSHAEGAGEIYEVKITGPLSGTTSNYTVTCSNPDDNYALRQYDRIQYPATLTSNIYTVLEVIDSTTVRLENAISGTLSDADAYLRRGQAIGHHSHSEGNRNNAYGQFSHAEGGYNTAIGAGSHVEGRFSKATVSSNHAEGYMTSATGGNSNNVSTYGAHSEGNQTTASGYVSHAEGYMTTASGGITSYPSSHAEGNQTTASGNVSHAEGYNTVASSFASHAEGGYTQTNNQYEHAEGKYNSSRTGSTDADKTMHSIGIGTGSTARKNAVEVMLNGDVYIDRVGNYNGSGTVKSLQTVLSEINTSATTKPDWEATSGAANEILNEPAIRKGGATTGSIIEGNYTTNNAPGSYSHAEGEKTRAFGKAAHSEGQGTDLVQKSYTLSNRTAVTVSGTTYYDYTTSAEHDLTFGDIIYVESGNKYGFVVSVPSATTVRMSSDIGALTSSNVIYGVTSGANSYSHSEGRECLASNTSSHAEGYKTKCCGAYAHAEGQESLASSTASHAEGRETAASGINSHAEGYQTTASGGSATYPSSHAEGYKTTASGNISHAEGANTVASTFASHAEGSSTQVSNYYEHAQGRYNVSHYGASSDTNFGDAGNTIHSIGIGTSSERKNAVEVMQSGDVYINGIGGYKGNSISSARTLQNIANIASKSIEITVPSSPAPTEGWKKLCVINPGSNFMLIITGAYNDKKAPLSCVSITNNFIYGTMKVIWSDDARSSSITDLRMVRQGDAYTWELDYYYISGRGKRVFTFVGENYSYMNDYLTDIQTSLVDAPTPTSGWTVQTVHLASQKEGNLEENVASGDFSHAEGNGTLAYGNMSHAEGVTTIARGSASHAEGFGTIALGEYSHAEGQADAASNVTGVIGGGTGATTSYSTSSAHGLTVGNVVRTTDGSKYAYVMTVPTTTTFTTSVTLGNFSSATTIQKLSGGVAFPNYSHVEGRNNTVVGIYGHAEGNTTLAYGARSHSEGWSTKAMDGGAHSEGRSTTASGANGSHAEGYSTTASGSSTHAEGYSTTASGTYSHAEGNGTTASGYSAHAEGSGTTASGGTSTYPSSHAEGMNTVASGGTSHAEGYYATAAAFGSHAEGCYTKTTSGNNYEHAQGRYNASHNNSTTWGDAGNTLHSIGIGNGTSDSNRRNAVEVMQNGDVYVYGIGNYNGQNPNTTGISPLHTVIGSLATDATVVHKTGSETIVGAKEFQSTVEIFDTYLIFTSQSQLKHPVDISLSNYYDDGGDGVAVLELDDSNGDGNVIVRSVYTPVQDYDAANKKYVDDIVGDIETLLAAI